jgi:flagellar hook-length control protein FliK
MSAIKMDLLTSITNIDPKPADNAAGNPSSLLPAFGEFLQMAQSQTAATTTTSALWNKCPSNDSRGSPAQTSATSQTNSNNAADQPSWHPAYRPSRRSAGDSASRQHSATPAGPSQCDHSSISGSQDAANAPSDSQNTGGQDTNKGSSNQGSGQQSQGPSQKDERKTTASDAPAVTVDISSAAAAASAAVIAGGSPPSATLVAMASASEITGNDAGHPVVQATQTGSAAAVNATGQAIASQIAPADSSSMASNQPTPSTISAAPADAATNGQSTQPADKNNVDVQAAAVAAAAAVPSATAVAATDSAASRPTPQQPAALNDVRAAASNQPVNLTQVANDSTANALDAQAETEQRVKSAVEAITRSNSGDGTPETTGKPENSASAPAAANPQAPAHYAAASGSGSNTAAGMEGNVSQADRVRFVQRVEQAFQDFNGQVGSVRLRLSPPELGSLQIEIRVAKGEMTAHVQAETTAARNILLDNLPALRERLAQHDIKVQRFDVDLMDRSTGGMSNQSSQYQNPSSQNVGGAFTRAPVRGIEPSEPPIEPAVSRPVGGVGRLNVVV